MSIQSTCFFNTQSTFQDKLNLEILFGLVECIASTLERTISHFDRERCFYMDAFLQPLYDTHCIYGVDANLSSMAITKNCFITTVITYFDFLYEKIYHNRSGDIE